jgi:hypothetical protein
MEGRSRKEEGGVTPAGSNLIRAFRHCEQAEAIQSRYRLLRRSAPRNDGSKNMWLPRTAVPFSRHP